jgi:hypothetical protein
VQRSADFWAVPGMAQMADFIFSGIFGPFREWPKMARILFFPGFLGRSGNGPKWLFFPGFLGRSGNGPKWLFFPDFWAVPRMAQNGAEFIISGIFGPFREWRNLSHSPTGVFSTTTANVGKILTE